MPSSSASSSSASSSSASSSSGSGGAGGAGGSGGSGGAGGAVEPSGFVPTDLPGCRWWLRADSVETDGQAVVSLGDRSGNGHVVSQADAARRATWIASSPAFNGRPALQFSKAQFYEKVGDIHLPFGNTPVTAFMVGSIDAIPDIGPNGFFAYHTGGAAHIDARVQGVNPFRVQAENPYTTTLGAGPAGSAHAFAFTYEAGTLRTFRDGTAGEVFQAAMWGGSSNPSLRVGTTDSGTPYSLYGGQIAEIVLFEGALNDADRHQVERYLRARYALP